VVVKKGFSDLEEASEAEEDMLDKAWGLEPQSRLSCQVVIGEDDLEIELPRYTINMVSEQN
jgi:2Fe-2S ferredoxin